MRDLSDRLSSLSPEKQALFRNTMLKKRTTDESGSQVIPQVPDASKPCSRVPGASHPLFDEYIIEGPDRETYISSFNVSRHWVLNEHRIMGKATLPGTAYLEMAKAAFEHHAGDGITEIRNVYLLEPLTVGENEDKEVRTILKKRKDRFEFSVTSRMAPVEDRWQEHAKGEITAAAAEHPETCNIGKIEAECNEKKIIITEEDIKLRSEIITFGPRWNNFKWVKLGADQALASLELPEAFFSDIQSYKLHPALLDNAVGFLSEQFRDEGCYLPFYYKSLKIRGSVSRNIYSHIRRIGNNYSQKEVQKFNITLTDGHGTKLLEIEEYTLRKAALGDVAVKQRQEQEKRNSCLEISSLGNLNTLTFRPADRRKPGQDEVEIEVYATGLNFKDILLSMGMFPAPPDGCIRVGSECAGKVVTLGEGVKGFRIGDKVVASGMSCFSAFITTPSLLIAHKPAHLSFEEAATIPVAFMTAYHTLVKLGRLCRGERVLIHAAAGGVGMAAVKIAQWIGAEIFATAGNPEKRRFLHSLGIEYVMDSRSLGFADEVMKCTDGEGVNMVLNSLAGEFISKSLSVLGPYGRFLEIGMRDIYSNSQLPLRHFEKSLSFFTINGVGPETPGFHSTFREVMQHFKEGNLTPLPYRVFPATEVKSAFEYMMHAKHIGKIVVSQNLKV